MSSLNLKVEEKSTKVLLGRTINKNNHSPFP